ncbi:MAG: hypothetical protein C0594_08030 [Marinilabiliales bacterium]|nr:MAG: hypothetical protein C0594_08030 [Marinilabiliales bacterium]
MENDIMQMTPEEVILAGLGRGPIDKNRVSTMGASAFRKQVIERIPTLPRPVQDKVKQNMAQMGDKQYFSVVSLSGTATDLLEKNQKSEDGVRNIDDAQIDENTYFLLQSISLQYRTGTSGKFDDLLPAALSEAVWSFKVKNRELFYKNPVDMFGEPLFGYNSNKPLGTYVLNNPKWIEPNQTLAFEIEDAASTLSGDVKLKLIGTEIRTF